MTCRYGVYGMCCGTVFSLVLAVSVFGMRAFVEQGGLYLLHQDDRSTTIIASLRLKAGKFDLRWIGAKKMHDWQYGRRCVYAISCRCMCKTARSEMQMSDCWMRGMEGRGGWRSRGGRVTQLRTKLPELFQARKSVNVVV